MPGAGAAFFHKSGSAHKTNVQRHEAEVAIISAFMHDPDILLLDERPAVWIP